MVKIVHSVPRNTSVTPFGKWLIWGALIVLLVSVSILVFSALSHDARDAACRCILCVFNHIPRDGEYVYNRYLPVISMAWVSLLVLLVCLVRYYVNKQR